MKKIIYLFCNCSYGSAYLDIFQQYAKKNTDFECYVVFSLKGVDENPRQFSGIFTYIKKCIYKHYSSIKLFNVGVKVIEVKDVNNPSFFETIPKGTVGFITGFNQIFQASVINRFSIFINFHPSILPHYRGAIPSYWVIKNCEKLTGFSVHVVVEKIDAGEILYQELVEINPGISESELDKKIANCGSFYFAECLRYIQAGKLLRKKVVISPYLHNVNYVPAFRR